MKSVLLNFAILCCLYVTIKSAAVEPTVVTELQKDSEQKTGVLSTNDDCIQPKETGRCFALFYRFAYDVEKRECVEFVYGGCAGNSNNFETKEDCERICLENKEISSGDDNNVDVSNTTVSSNPESETTTEQVASI